MSVTTQKKPDWLRVRLPGGGSYHRIKGRLREKKLVTVCEEAKCPNISECWNGGTATLMILGEICTRGCRFCAVKSGNPKGALDPFEPQKCAETVSAMNLSYVVITCVDRDDLPDGGAAHFAAVIHAVRKTNPNCFIEVLASDYQGCPTSIATVSQANPDVFAHNLETVQRLTPKVRDRRASYEQSLGTLEYVKKLEPDRLTKSSLMLGLGESKTEVLEALHDLRHANVDIVTLGQYLRPSPKHLAVESYVAPEVFDELGEKARQMGFLYAASGPLVRSSYKAGEYFLSSHLARQKALKLRGAFEV